MNWLFWFSPTRVDSRGRPSWQSDHVNRHEVSTTWPTTWLDPVWTSRDRLWGRHVRIKRKNQTMFLPVEPSDNFSELKQKCAKIFSNFAGTEIATSSVMLYHTDKVSRPLPLSLLPLSFRSCARRTPPESRPPPPRPPGSPRHWTPGTGAYRSGVNIGPGNRERCGPVSRAEKGGTRGTPGRPVGEHRDHCHGGGHGGRQGLGGGRCGECIF